MTDPRIDPERLAKGRAVFTEVYGSDALLPPEGMMMPADMMITQAFAEVWSREALSIPIRRLLVIGVLAATGFGRACHHVQVQTPPAPIATTTSSASSACSGRAFTVTANAPARPPSHCAHGGALQLMLPNSGRSSQPSRRTKARPAAAAESRMVVKSFMNFPF